MLGAEDIGGDDSMTHWTDLIDTDPVAAYNLFQDWLVEYPKKGLGEDPIFTDNLRRLMSNLAELCEHLLAALSEAEEAIDEN